MGRAPSRLDPRGEVTVFGIAAKEALVQAAEDHTCRREENH